MTSNAKEFWGGVCLLAVFLVVLILTFMPLFNGKNGLNYLDNLFNAISKGSAYYIPALQSEVQNSQIGQPLSVKLTYDSEDQAGQSALLFEKAQASVVVNRTQLTVNGDLGKILTASLADADILFHNQDEKLQTQYGIEGRRVLYNWWTSLKALQKELNKQEKFDQAQKVYTITTRAVECAYNYHKVVPDNIKDRMGMVIFALVFYVVYTLWYGYAILFIFEGWGLHISH